MSVLSVKINERDYRRLLAVPTVYQYMSKFILDEGKLNEYVYVLHATVNVMRVFFTNNSAEPLVFKLDYTQPWSDTLEVPPGLSCICLCTSSCVGMGRRDNSYTGFTLYAVNPQIRIKIVSGNKSSDFMLNVTIYTVKSPPTLLQLAKQAIRDQHSWDCSKIKFEQLKDLVPVTLAEEVAKDYKELYTAFWSQTYHAKMVFHCKCTLFWYKRGQYYAQLGPNFPAKNIIRYHYRHTWQ